MTMHVLYTIIIYYQHMTKDNNYHYYNTSMKSALEVFF